MQTRKDLVQAHRLMGQRASLALLLGDPDSAEFPLRRLNVGLVCGVMVSVLVSAIFGIVGLMRPGGATVLRKAGTLIIASDNGTRYVWCQNGKLCPVANYASARLVAGERKVVTSGSLRGFQRGPLIGIPGAPDTVPEARQLLKTPWSVCVRTAESAFAGRRPVVTLVVGRRVGGRRLGDDQAVVVTDGQQPWLIWQNRRVRVPPGSVSALTSTPPARVSGKWLNALPTGADFTPPQISGRGEHVAGLEAGALVGQIIRVDAAAGQSVWYVMLGDGLAKITETEARLLLTDPETQKAYPGQNVGAFKAKASDVAAAPVSKQTVGNRQLPAKPPAIQPYSGSMPLCTTYDDRTGKRGAYLTLGGKLDSPPGTAGDSANGVDEMALPAGGGAIAGLLPNPGQSSAVNTYFLVTEGKRFALKSPEVGEKLGYRLAGDAVPIPANILGLIPNGPVLDPNAVSTPISSSGQIGS